MERSACPHMHDAVNEAINAPSPLSKLNASA